MIIRVTSMFYIFILNKDRNNNFLKQISYLSKVEYFPDEKFGFNVLLDISIVYVMRVNDNSPNL